MTAKPTGFRELQRQLIEVADRGGDARPALAEVAEMFRTDMRHNFARGGRPRWAPVSPAYAARKARTGHGARVGVYTGGMRDSFLHPSDPYNLEVIKEDRLRVGSTNPVGHLFGGKHTVHKQPRRKLVSITPSRRREYLAFVQDYLVTGDL